MKKMTVFLLLLTCLLTSCSGPKTVALRETEPPPAKDQTTPTKPSPSPGTSPSPQEPGSGGNGSLPNPTPNPDQPPLPNTGKVARIFCESQPVDARSFNTLRADVYSNFITPSVTSYVNGKPVTYVKSPQPLQSDGATALLILRAQEDFFSSWGIYKSSVDLYHSQAELQKISGFSKPAKNAQFIYNQLKLENRILTANLKRTAYVYPNDKGAYVWENLKGSRFVLPFSAESSFSPQFVGDDAYLRFDNLTSGDRGLTQKFYHFDSKKTWSLPSPADRNDSQLFGHVNASKTTIYWIEGRPGSSWKLRSIGIKSGAKALTLATLPGNPQSLVLPVEMLSFKDETLVASLEEEVALNSHAQMYFKTASLHLLKVDSKKSQMISAKTTPYSEELTRMVKMETDFKQGLLRNLFYEPISGKLYASNIPKGGLVSFDFNKNSWSTHGMVGNVFGCLNPQWGLEVLDE